MDGIVIVNKEKGMTSFDVVSKMRKIFNTKKVGHLGTLDPLAYGVLGVCINDACKLVQFLENDNKEYIAEVCLGMSTNTYDLDGEVIETKKPNNYSEDEIDKCLNSFLGSQKQIPPIYSAIKVNGKKLYNYARDNQTVELAPRDINIYEIERITPLIYENDLLKFKIRTVVSKGTYIRSLCYDIGTKLMVPSVMSDLQRIRSGSLLIDKASTLSEIEKGNYTMISVLDALGNYPIIDNDYISNKAFHGMKISIKDIVGILNDKPKEVVIKKGDSIIAIYSLDNESYCYRALRVWN